MIVDVKFSKTFQFKFIYDTGAESTIFTEKTLCELLQIPFVREYDIYGSDRSTAIKAHLITSIHLQLKEVESPLSNLLVIDGDILGLEEIIGVRVHGIIGADFFRNFVVKIDFRKSVIQLTKPEYFKPPSAKHFTAVPMEVIRNKLYLNTQLKLNNSDSIEARLLIDTGASLYLLLHVDSHEKLTLPEHFITGQIGMGIGGTVKGFVGRVNKVKIGPRNFNAVIANYQDAVVADSLNLTPKNGIIGSLLLRRFNMILDSNNEMLYLQPLYKKQKRFTYDRSGLVILATGPRLKNFLVGQVIAGSPAHVAGIQANDEILKINGRKSRYFTLNDVLRKFQKKVGKKIRLQIKRDDKILDIEFRLEDLI